MADFIDFRTLKRPNSPNTFLLAPAGLCANATSDGAAPIFDLSASDLFARVKQFVDARPSWAIADLDETNFKLHIVITSRLLKFKDDLDIDVIHLSDGKSDLAIYSRSRVGYSDLGTNRKRVTQIIDHLTSI